jgi:dTDP-4-amino-4,6-dideoxygalactose transaminase
VTNDAVLFDRMLLLGHYRRLKNGQAANTFDTDCLSLGLKYRPHLYAILLALGSLSRLAELNEHRQRSYRRKVAECAQSLAAGPPPDRLKWQS